MEVLTGRCAEKPSREENQPRGECRPVRDRDDPSRGTAVPAPEKFAKQATAKPAIYEDSFAAFREREGRERITWFEPFTELHEWEPPYAKFYLGGELNICFNCVDRHVEAGSCGAVGVRSRGSPVVFQREVPRWQ